MTDIRLRGDLISYHISNFKISQVHRQFSQIDSTVIAYYLYTVNKTTMSVLISDDAGT